MSEIIKIGSKEKSTSIRLSEKTKKALESLSSGKETHDQIISRLVKIVNNLSQEEGTQIIKRKNAIGTKYDTVHKTIDIETGKNNYNIVCTYNDLVIFNILRSKRLSRNVDDKQYNISQWEVDLEIVNVQKNDKGWSHPSNLDKSEYMLLYLVALKHILEEYFDVKLYELATDNDFFSLDRWDEAYKRNKLSTYSYYSDVEKRLQGHA